MASVIDNVSLGGFVTKYDALNKSTAKTTYSFSKASRFPSVKKEATMVMCYDLPNGKSKRSTGFGIGNRFQTPKNDRNGSSK